MKYRVIDSDNYKSACIETMFFPGGEPHIKVPVTSGPKLYFLKLQNWNDVGHAALLSEFEGPEDAAFIPYYPGARQDHVDQKPVTVGMISSMLTWSNIHVFDPHSSKTTDYTGAEVWMPSDLDVPKKADVVGIIAPDEGATDRAEDFLEVFYPEAELIQCIKKRDPKTGKLSGYHVLSEAVSPGRYIVVDDICDGGGTFNLLAQEWKDKGFDKDTKLELFVSHGIFSKGLDNVDPVYEHVTTTDSWCGRYDYVTSQGRLIVLPLNQLFDRIMGV